MKFRTFQVFLISVAILLGACRKEDPIVPNVLEIPDIIQPYIDLFEAEAAKRGKDIKIDNLIVEFEGNLQDGTAAGLCNFETTNSPPHIRLDTTSTNWTNNEASREILVFHELGHCILNRLHRDDLLPNTNYVSIMRSTGSQVYGGSLNAFKRDYYLDELFDENTPAPDWATNVPAYNDVSESQKGTVFSEEFDNAVLAQTNGWTLGSSTSTSSSVSGGSFFFESKDAEVAYFTTNEKVLANLDSNNDFEIESRIKIISGEQSSMMQWGGSGGANLFFYGFNSDTVAFTGNWETGVAVNKVFEDLIRNEFNTLTIRKIGEFYYFYLNEKLFDVLAFEAFKGDLFAFYIGPQTKMEVDYVRVFELTL